MPRHRSTHRRAGQRSETARAARRYARRLGGEFGRTVYCQGRLTDVNYGRDHHPRNFTMWLAGGGIKPGVVLGETDDFSYNVTADPVHVHDLQATILRCLGVDHKKLTFKFQSRHFRLTDVHGEVVDRILA